MGNLFWGFFFILLDFNFTSNNHIIGFLPDFLGFVLIYKGLLELQSYSMKFKQIQPLAMLMAAVKFITYMMDLFGVSNQNQNVMIPVGLILLALYFYIEYTIICGIRDMERVLGIDLNASTMFILWYIVLICGIIAYISLFIPPLATVFIVLSAVMSIIFLTQLHRSKVLYEQNQNHRF
jgi:hypothetical protein